MWFCCIQPGTDHRAFENHRDGCRLVYHPRHRPQTSYPIFHSYNPRSHQLSQISGQSTSSKNSSYSVRNPDRTKGWLILKTSHFAVHSFEGPSVRLCIDILCFMSFSSDLPYFHFWAWSFNFASRGFTQIQGLACCSVHVASCWSNRGSKLSPGVLKEALRRPPLTNFNCI